MKQSGVMLGTDNSARLAEFYTKAHGEPVWHQDDWWGYGEGGSIIIGPHSEVHGESHEPARIMIAFECENVEAEFKRLKEAGAKVVAEPYHPGAEDEGWLATIADPDGNYLQLATPWKED